MNQLQRLFQYQGCNVRVVMLNGEPWFVLKDVCEILELGQVAGVKRRLSEDVISNHPLQTAGGLQQMTVINEDGLYDVVLESRKPEAKAFRKWITSEVLPTIRKTGSYFIEQSPMVQEYLSWDEEQRAIAYFKEKREHRIAKEQLAIAAPKAEMFDVIASSKNSQPIGSVAKSFNWGRNKMFKFLRNQKVLMKSNEPYQAYIERGYFVVRQVPVAVGDGTINRTQTLVTAKGIDFIGRLLKNNGLLA
ncbi:phage antirepressor KilAC domain-containing protein [Aneurinibacillus thermoaerophilus]|uniref:phage antirepressor KilAC domain-containing protein n=1 Tax=Aneurinibacillus thermoaerophilus TaxID=143495 RepID=UPI002E240670|nr:phage antirepressor KilAC domain-containing protein [Aneurinibacillus thermoaerophilus]MED0759018.1 phage antirepressor KilAC domain-containing protein [Aneurinibacillus thermoaerophilus]MED0762324.1 phage antirepressor KilAC domain-containing protein [Aneurinibacillus thermoaerophilus]